MKYNDRLFMLLLLIIISFLVGWSPTSLSQQQSSVPLYANFEEHSTLPLTFMERVKKSGYIEVDSLSIRNFKQESELEQTVKEFITNLNIVNGWDESIGLDSVITKDVGVVVFHNDRDEYMQSLLPNLNVSFSGICKISENINGLIFLVNKSVDSVEFSKNMYLMTTKGNEVRSIFQVAYQFHLTVHYLLERLTE